MLDALRRPARVAPGDPVEAAREAAARAAARAADLDRSGAFPAEDVADLARLGLLHDPVPTRLGGRGLGSDRLGSEVLLAVLRLIGQASLPLGRLYEGHVNAWRLIARFGFEGQAMRLAQDAASGHLFGVWNTEGAEPVCFVPAGEGWRIEGAKVFASGAGDVTRPLITGRTPKGEARMAVVRLDDPSPRADMSPWRVSGMRASRTGTFDFTGIELAPDDLLGNPGDYLREPDFSGGAWRFAAVHSGGIEALVAATKAHLNRTGRGGDPHQAARFGQMVMAAETARLWLAQAARLAGDETPPAEVVAQVGMTRLAVERAALEALELAHRSVGMSAFLQPHPLERITRDLQLYLRQPAPDKTLVNAAAHALARDE